MGNGDFFFGLNRLNKRLLQYGNIIIIIIVHFEVSKPLFHNSAEMWNGNKPSKTMPSPKAKNQ